jgi:hypothetical protein
MKVLALCLRYSCPTLAQGQSPVPPLFTNGTTVQLTLKTSQLKERKLEDVAQDPASPPVLAKFQPNPCLGMQRHNTIWWHL